jgi:hypothetical protein
MSFNAPEVQLGLLKKTQARSEEILLVSAANFDNLRRHSDQKHRTHQSATTVLSPAKLHYQ